MSDGLSGLVAVLLWSAILLGPRWIQRRMRGARTSTKQRQRNEALWEQDEPWALDVNYDAYDESEL